MTRTSMKWSALEAEEAEARRKWHEWLLGE